MPNEQDLNPLDVYAAIRQMQDTKGWKILMERYAKEGDDILTKILDINNSSEQIYSKRDLWVFQMHALGRIQKIIVEIEEEAKLEQERLKHPLPIGK